MKLFVWQNVFRDYTAGIAFAIAEDSDQARALIAERMNLDLGVLGDLAQLPEVYDLSKPIGFGKWGGG